MCVNSDGANLKKTSVVEFSHIFYKLTSENIECYGQINKLNLYMLKISNKLFVYDKLYECIFDNVCQYVFNRKRNSEAEQNSIKNRRLLAEAIHKFKPITNNDDKGAGGELGEILLYIFLEQCMEAPKMFSKMELKTNSNMPIHGVDAIHYKFRLNSNNEKILQIVIGESKTKKDLKTAIKDAVESIDKYITHGTNDNMFLDRIDNEFRDQQEIDSIKKLLIDGETQEKIFGIFIGFSIVYSGTDDSNDDFKNNIQNSVQKQILDCKDMIKKEISNYKIRNHEFNFYFLPFHDVEKDRKAIMRQLIECKPKFEWEDLRYA